MKRITSLAIIFLFLSGFSLRAQEDNKIKWYSIEEAVELNKKNPKKFFIDVYTDWCGWCKKMDANTFTDPVIVQYMNEHFWPVKFNAEGAEPITISGQKYVNPNPGKRRSTHQLAAALLNGKLSYPSFAFLDQDVKLITVLPGYNPPEKLEPVLHYIAEGAYKEETFQTFRNNFKGSFD
ncbi:MAG: thioredoxin family protein [Bacteroidota bacterium]